MTDLVIDASVVGAWYLPKQGGADTDRLLDACHRFRWLSPHCFSYEVPNLILKHERRGALPKRATNLVLEELAERVRVRILPPPPMEILELAIVVARDHGISLFDAFYILEARDRTAALVSRDMKQLRAAEAEGCPIADLATLT